MTIDNIVEKLQVLDKISKDYCTKVDVYKCYKALDLSYVINYPNMHKVEREQLALITINNLIQSKIKTNYQS